MEVYGLGAGELPAGAEHLGVRAFALLAPVEGRRFVFTNHIPLNGGLGSSAATIALGLVAACAATGRALEVEELVELGLELEGHADNLAPAFAGGACLSWRSGGRQRVVRLAGSLPFVPIAVVPDAQVDTRSRPRGASGGDPARGRLVHRGPGGAPRGRSREGLCRPVREAFEDRLHQPFRGPLSPVYAPIRDELPRGADGVTVSGSGPTVIVWAAPEKADVCALELAGRFPSAHVLVLAVAAHGAAVHR